jgi:hypothetical protein
MHIQKTEDYSVKFGRDPALGLESQKAFPFIYTLVNHSDDTWVGSGFGGFPNLCNLGPVIPAGTTKQINVLLDADYNFKLLAIKYSVYAIDENLTYYWFDASQGLISAGMIDGEDFPGDFLCKYVGVTLSFQGSGSTILYGGADTGAFGGNRVPLQLDVIQGFEYGFLTTRTPYLLPRQGVLSFEFTNNYNAGPRGPSDVVVAAAIYGMKIRV